ncbi:MAG: YraN family protein [Chitinophagaceae bacterium]|nr:YraN family protein [Chitinophagaceae bacterium]MCW5925469.1 YraN family protein [Chitinophagaceae bacterium]
MANHNKTGKQGELLAVNYLTDQGFSILHTNWRYSRYEIDIIAERNKILHFIEVKTRRSDRYGLPEESVTAKKFENLSKAAEAFLEENPGWNRIQYDTLAIMLKPGGAEYFLIEDVAL